MNFQCDFYGSKNKLLTNYFSLNINTILIFNLDKFYIIYYYKNIFINLYSFKF